MKKFTISSMMALITALLIAMVTACAPEAGIKSGSVESQNSNKIIGGTTVVPGSALSKQVFMLYGITPQGGAICTATMITETVGLTAAHCVDGINGGYAIFSIMASDRLAKIKSRQQLQNDPRIIQLKAVRIHPSWTGDISQGNNGDIAVFKLVKPKPADIEITQIHTEGLRRGTTVVASGYGINTGSLGSGSGTLRETKIQVLNPNETQTEFSVNQRGGHGVCSGDSGGPSFVVSPFGRLKQVGVVSYGEEGCEVNGVYTYVAAYTRWIQDAINSMR